MPHIFVSYSHQDEPITRRIVAYLEAAGFDVWVDYQSIQPGKDWEDSIEQGIADCDALLLIQTPRSKASQRVKKEWLYAEHLKKPIYPVLCEGEIWFSFVDVQYTDLRADFDMPLASLVQALPSQVLPGGIIAANAAQVVRLEEKFKHDTSIFNALAFSKSGRFLGVAGGHGAIEVANMFAKTQDDRPIWFVSRFGFEGKSLAFSPDENLLVVGTRNQADRNGLKIFDMQARREIYASRESSHVAHVRFSSDGELLIAAEGGLTPRIFVYEVNKFKLLDTLKPESTGTIRCLTISPDNDVFLTGGRAPKGVCIWSLLDGAKREYLDFDPKSIAVVDMAFSADGKFLAVGTAGGDVWFWNRSTGTRDDSPLSVGQPIRSIALNPRGDVLAVGLDLSQDLGNLRGMGLDVGDDKSGEIQLWNIAQKQIIVRLVRFRSTVNALAFSPDGKLLASAGADKRLHLWGIP